MQIVCLFLCIKKSKINTFVFACICIKKLWNNAKEVDKSGFFEGGVDPRHMENRVHARLHYVIFRLLNHVNILPSQIIIF